MNELVSAVKELNEAVFQDAGITGMAIWSNIIW